MTLVSSIYSGSIMHRRLRPRRHRFRYRTWWLLVDVADLPRLCQGARLLSHNRFNIFSIYDRDYGCGEKPLAEGVGDCLARAGIDATGKRIFLLTTPRILGYAFNPLSLYFCVDDGGTITAIVYEVHNTYAERHSYVMPAETSDEGIIRHATDKAFYVSPFLPMRMRYAFRLRQPGERIDLAISATISGATVLHASLEGQRQPLTDVRLARIFVTQPLATLKVIAAIHWEALRLWLKGLPIVTRPASAPTPPAAAQGQGQTNLHA